MPLDNVLLILKGGGCPALVGQPLWHRYERNGSLVALAVALTLALLA